MILAVYGTLREGQYNHDRFLKDKEPVSTELVSGYDMYSLGGYPFVTRGSDNILIELYELSYTECAGMIGMELGAGYTVEGVDTSLGEAMLFTFDEWRAKRSNQRKIDGGDWVQFSRDERKKEYANSRTETVSGASGGAAQA